MTEQNGMDILCDAVESDLLTSFLAPSPQEQRSTKRVKVADDGASPPASPHICHICKRVYESDLLTRHETTHDRDDGGKGKSIIRRSDRAAEACVNCAASKAKCDDQKPCGRCRSKSLACQTFTKRGSAYGNSDAPTAEPSSDSPGMTSNSATTVDTHNGMSFHTERRVQFLSDQSLEVENSVTATSFSTDFVPQPLAADDMFYFNPTHSFYPDMDFTTSWELNFDSYTIPQVDLIGPSPQSSTTSATKHPVRDPNRGYAAFKRSPWLWEPKTKDSLGNEQEGLMFNEKSIAHSPAYEKMLASSTNKRLKMDPTIRDKLFALVLSQHKHPTKVPSFPSLDLLNYLLQTYFVQDDYQTDSWIHSASFDPSSAIPELLGALISSGATFIADPAIWQFGLALQEVVRMGLSVVFENNNSKTRDLQCLQAFILELDIGLWSGFKRKMEMAESFLLPPVTMMRRAGTFSTPADTPYLVPSPKDSLEEVEAKWQKFIKRESYKRLALHVYFHDGQASVALQNKPLMSYTELSFSLPASRDLWRAPTAEAWREIYLRKKPLPSGITLPKVNELMHSITLLDTFEEFVDMELCYSAVLYGFWGQITAYREAVRFYDHHSTADNRRASVTHRLWLTSQHQELYRDVSEFAMLISSSPKLATQLSVVAELFMMILHVSPDELQRFAGKHGEDEARHAGGNLEDNWAGSRDARHAVWHAGQVIRNGRILPPASLRGFNAIAVYYASLALWIYGLLSCSNSTQGQRPPQMLAPPTYVLVDGNESRETRAFLQLDKGIPGITLNGDVHSGVESLSNPGMVLNVTRNVFRDNYPVRTEPLPPLVESLGNLLRDLGTGPAGRASRVQSRAASEDRGS
ncbi:hypothetical protein TruAng_008368 [Truncatella angustata]|nr:hypothetical protein TruAng_008368 [Truncatella angustata]